MIYYFLTNPTGSLHEEEDQVDETSKKLNKRVKQNAMTLDNRGRFKEQSREALDHSSVLATLQDALSVKFL